MRILEQPHPPRVHPRTVRRNQSTPFYATNNKKWIGCPEGMIPWVCWLVGVGSRKRFGGAGSIGTAQRSEGLVAAVVDGPEGVQVGQAQQLADALGDARQDHLAAMHLNGRVAAQQERQEDRAKVVH